MQSPVTLIRSLAPEDAAFIRDMAGEAFSEYGGGDAGAHTVSLVFESGARTFIAEHDGRRIGFATVGVRGDEAHLHAIAVLPEWRGRGIGQKLLRAVERNAKARGAIVIRLETGEANLGAIDLFVRSGYERERRVPRYYSTGYDALIFGKRLS